MSAGRGTPRVSPSGGALTTVTTQDDVARAFPLNQASFGATISNFPANTLVLTASLQAYLPANAPGSTFKWPSGATRGLIAFQYVEGAPNGQADIFLDFIGGAILGGSGSVFVGTDKVIPMRRILYRVYHTGPGIAFLPFVIPVSAQGVVIYALESGNPGTPGTFSVGDVRVDNLAVQNVDDNT